jgi:hypothetical protein
VRTKARRKKIDLHYSVIGNYYLGMSVGRYDIGAFGFGV